MKIQIIKRSDFVLCELPNGNQLEITQIETKGEDAEFSTSEKGALQAVQQHLQCSIPVIEQDALSSLSWSILEEK